MRKCWIVFLSLLLGSFLLRAEGKIEERLANTLRQLPDDGRVLAWVYFTDKGSHELLKTSVPPSVVSERALRRRARVSGASALVDYDDLPLDRGYVEETGRRVILVRHQLKWFNSISVLATKGQLFNLQALPFVREISLVAQFARTRSEEVPAPLSEAPLSPTAGVIESPPRYDYGASLSQLSIINVLPLHDEGNSGQGILIGVFDNGFRMLEHQAFDQLRSRIVTTYDFVDKKVSVVPNHPSLSFGKHGTNVLSILGGFKPGQLIGPAFGADFILARTENDSSETPVEEDNWAAAIQWAESLGVDVTSTSLGYLGFDPPNQSWTWEDMNGRTTVISRAATRAARRGVVVVNSAGNDGSHPTHNTLGAPADADSIISVGAVTSGGDRSSFSSVGPTADGRNKPDVMAQGSSVYYAEVTGTAAYSSGNGTSFSCPAVAGVAALMLHAKPAATPMEILEALRSTASQANNPNRLTGWGIIDAQAAVNYLTSRLPLSYFRTSVSQSSIGLAVTIEWRTVSQLNVLGYEIQRAPNRTQTYQTIPNSFIQRRGSPSGAQEYSFVDNSVTSGLWSYRLKVSFADSTTSFSSATAIDVQLPLEFRLGQNFPNPFPLPANPGTTITFRLPQASTVNITVYDILGRAVRTVLSEERPAGAASPAVFWDGKDKYGIPVASGVYFYRISAKSANPGSPWSATETKKLVILR